MKAIVSKQEKRHFGNVTFDSHGNVSGATSALYFHHLCHAAMTWERFFATLFIQMGDMVVRNMRTGPIKVPLIAFPCLTEATLPLDGKECINEYPSGCLLRDVKLYEIGAGTSGIRRWLIGREMMAES